MTMMNGFDARDIDILDEEYFGPPPRFLVEGRAGDYRDGIGEFRFEDQESALPGLKKIKQLLGMH